LAAPEAQSLNSFIRLLLEKKVEVQQGALKHKPNVAKFTAGHLFSITPFEISKHKYYILQISIAKLEI
jgi:hypothetical protein